MDKKTIAAMIDHTLLKPEATPAQIEKLCAEAAEYHFASVCVNPVYIPLAARLLKGTGVKVCCVVGFPLGAIAPEQKAAEAASCAAMGAEELDMVIHVGAAKAGDWALVQRDIEGVVKAAAGHTVKVIIETCLLTDEEKVKACEAAKAAGAHFVKTSTGFYRRGHHPRYCPDAQNRGAGDGCQGQWRHPGLCDRDGDDRSRGQPHWRFRGDRYCGGRRITAQ